MMAFRLRQKVLWQAKLERLRGKARKSKTSAVITDIVMLQANLAFKYIT